MSEIPISYSMLDSITKYMNPDIRDDVQMDCTPCTPQKFLEEYLRRDTSQEFANILYSQFKIGFYKDRYKIKTN